MLPTCAETASAMIGSLEDILGRKLAPATSILDFGCGRGDLVRELCERGFDARGVDIKNFWSDDLDGRLLLLDVQRRIPHSPMTFDAVLSTSVFEHVLDYRTAFQEIHRVLKTQGSSLHLFPGPWTLPVEPHIYVPLASVLQARWWLTLWAWFGVRNEFQVGLDWREVVERNVAYCKTGISYLPRRETKALVRSIFGNVYYAKREYIKNFHGGAARLARRSKLPFMGDMIFSWREQLIYSQKMDQS